jgi:twitching motility protein PilT
MSVAQQEGDVQVPVPELLGVLLDKHGSDLHLTAGSPPVVRVHGELVTVTEYPVLTPRALQGMVYAILPQKLRERFEQELELDMSYSLPGRARFRVNVFMQRDAVGAVFRVIPFEIMSIEDLGLPSVVADLARFPRGFVVVTGPTGSGKSTTLAAMVDVVNRERAGHIMTVEDPIEFLHKHKTCIVNQREIGADTHSFSQALKHVLRQDPDVILVGEMRDLETIGTAITAAETGHLVFATLHTQDAPQTIDRIIDVFPPHQQQQVRVQLSTTLQGVVTQQLMPTADGQGRVAAIEVMIATPGIRNLVREGKVHQIYSAMQAGGRYGMQTMDMSLAQHVKAGRITQQMAFERCHDPEELDRLVGSALQARSDGYSGAALDVGMSMGSM